MSFFKKISTRWTGEQLASWSSMSKTLYLLFPLLVYYLVGDLVEIILWWVLNKSFEGASPETIEKVSAFGSTIQGMIYGIGLLVGAAIIWRAAMEEVTFIPAGEEKAKMKPVEYIIVIVAGLVFSIGLNYLFNVLGITGASESFQSARKAQFSVDFLAGIFLYGVLSPVVEELIFRGLLFNRLKRIFPRLAAIILSALLFGIFHGNLVQGTYAFIMGVIIALLYEKYKSFLAPIVFHVVANVGVYVLQYTIWK